MRLSLGTQMPSAYAELGLWLERRSLRDTQNLAFSNVATTARPVMTHLPLIDHTFVPRLRHDLKTPWFASEGRVARPTPRKVFAKVRIRWGHSEYATTPFHQGCIQRTAGGYSCVYL